MKEGVFIMSKIITLTRQELVWQTRENSWSEQDYKNYLQWLKGFKEQMAQAEPTTWARNNAAIYDALAAYTWDEIVDIIEKDNYDEEPKIQIIHDDGEVWYTTRISEIIKDAMREDNYDCDVVSEDYADDYDEEWRADTIND